MSIRPFVILAAFAAGALAFAAGNLALAEEPLVKDLRAKGSKSTRTVVICSREGTPGHAFVVLGHEDEEKLVSSVEAFGFYPDDKLKAVFGPVPVKLANEFAQGKGTAKAACRVIAKVDEPTFRKVNAIRRDWVKRKYDVLEADCVTFTGDVCTALGLKTPERIDAKLPAEYVRQVFELNEK